MHATAFFALDGWRSARFAGTGLGAAALARKHRPGVAWMITRHFFFRVRDIGTSAPLLLSMIGIGAALSWLRANGGAAVPFGGASRWPCVNVADDGLAAFADVDMLNRDYLLAARPVASLAVSHRFA
jgi:hypothetical protein